MKWTWLPRSRILTPFLVAMLEFGEILDRLQGPLRAEQALDIDTAQWRRVDATAMFLRAHVAR